MGGLAWSQVRFRPARTLALITGVLVAATAFTMASRTAQVRTQGSWAEPYGSAPYGSALYGSALYGSAG